MRDVVLKHRWTSCSVLDSFVKIFNVAKNVFLSFKGLGVREVSRMTLGWQIIHVTHAEQSFGKCNFWCSFWQCFTSESLENVIVLFY